MKIGLTQSQMTTGAKTLKINVSLGFSWLEAPITENTKAKGILPVAREAKIDGLAFLKDPPCKQSLQA